MVFRPLAGCGLFLCTHEKSRTRCRFRPLAGCGLFLESNGEFDAYERFPSPCGVWVVSLLPQRRSGRYGFRPLAGCGLFPSGRCLRHGLSGVSVPLRGVGCFEGYLRGFKDWWFPSPCGVWVVSWDLRGRRRNYACFRPLAGCGLFPHNAAADADHQSFRPLAGCGLFPGRIEEYLEREGRFRPLAGCGLFPGRPAIIVSNDKFPSPCGVWVVSREG